MPAGAGAANIPLMADTQRPISSRLSLAGLGAWLLVSLPTPLSAAASPRFPFWLLASLGYAAALTVATRRPLGPRALRLVLLAEAGCVVAMVGLLSNGFEGSLLAIAAAQLGVFASLPEGALWIVGQTAAAGTAIALHWTPRAAALLVPPYLGLQLFAFFLLRQLVREGAIRAVRSRLEERLRIAQELHDALGHHLTAMSLNLEAAAHQTEGPARESVRTAQSLARSLLSDVKEIVRTLKAEAEVDLAGELSRLALEVPSPRIHLTMPPELRLPSPALAATLLRCVQEIVTNAIRHASARNLWIELVESPDGVRLCARDDGQGTAAVQPGNGLSGMRRRVEELGGTLDIESGPGAGFALRAVVPPAAGR